MDGIAGDRPNQAKYREWIVSKPHSLDDWRKRNPGRMLDCANMDLTGANLQNRDISCIDFTGSIFRGAQLTGANLERSTLKHTSFANAKLIKANLRGADLTLADFSSAELQSSDLTDSRIDTTKFDGALLQDASFSVPVDMRRSSFAEANLGGCKLAHASFKGCELYQASLHDTDCFAAFFDQANLDEATLARANLRECSFVGTHLRGASFEDARLDGAYFEGTILSEAIVSGASFDRVIGLPSCLRLESVRTGPNLPRYLDSVVAPFVDRVLSWDRLRVVGRLPLFGVSYSALVLMPFLFYLLEVFNSKVSQIREVAGRVPPETATGHLAKTLLEHLKTEPVPRLSFVLFLCTIVLAAGATIYAILCPARIKEFSKDQWEDQLGRSLIHYLPFTWKHRWARLACAACYAVGGTGVLFVLLTKIVSALVYLAKAEVG